MVLDSKKHLERENLRKILNLIPDKILFTELVKKIEFTLNLTHSEIKHYILELCNNGFIKIEDKYISKLNLINDKLKQTKELNLNLAKSFVSKTKLDTNLKKVELDRLHYFKDAYIKSWKKYNTKSTSEEENINNEIEYILFLKLKNAMFEEFKSSDVSFLALLKQHSSELSLLLSSEDYEKLFPTIVEIHNASYKDNGNLEETLPKSLVDLDK